MLNAGKQDEHRICVRLRSILDEQGTIAIAYLESVQRRAAAQVALGGPAAE